MSQLIIAVKSFTLTDWLAIFGAALGLAGFVLSLIALLRHRRKIKVQLIASRLGGREEQYIYCDMNISNISLSPIAVNNLSIIDNNNDAMPCSMFTNRVSHVTNGKNEVSNEVYTSIPPITIAPFSSYRGVFAFDIPCENYYKNLKNSYSKKEYWTVKLNTTRGTTNIKVYPPHKTGFRTHFPFPFR